MDIYKNGNLYAINPFVKIIVKQLHCNKMIMHISELYVVYILPYWKQVLE